MASPTYTTHASPAGPPINGHWGAEDPEIVATLEGEQGIAVRHPEDAYPMGSNRIRSIAFNFNQRLKYKNGKYFEGIPQPIDTLYDKIFYGKVDRLQNVIIPKVSRPPEDSPEGNSCDPGPLRQIGEKNIFALDFVAENFYRLQRNIKIASDNGHLCANNSFLFEFGAKRAWFDIRKIYAAYLPKVLEKYNHHIKLASELKKIRTFEEYVEGLMRWVEGPQFEGALTLTELVLTSAISPRCSGLAVEIDSLNQGDDLIKYTTYIEDVNFRYYVRAARKFGFYIDKNVPWRLFADPLSAPMLDGLAEVWGPDVDIRGAFFDKYYDRTYTLDMSLLQLALRRSWNTLATQHRLIIETIPPTVRCPTPSFTHTATRSTVSAAYVEGLPAMFWFNKYIRIRSAESGVFYKNVPYLTRESVNVGNAYGYERGLQYINNLFKPYLYDERIFKKHLTPDSESVIVGSVLDIATTSVGGGGY
jgi:hypothetical protein